MKRSIYLILATCALVCLTGCDKVNPNGPRSKEEQAFLEDDAIACVISSLTGENATEFNGKIFNATYGVALDSGYFIYTNEEEFKKGFYENGTVAVYTLDYKAFCRANWYGVKVDY